MNVDSSIFMHYCPFPVNLHAGINFCSTIFFVMLMIIHTHKHMLCWQERGFLSLSAAVLSSPVLRVEEGLAMEIFMDIASSIEAVILSFLFCRSGWVQLLSIHKYICMYIYTDTCSWIYY